MDLRGKLTVLADAAKYDVSCSSSGSDRSSAKGKLGAPNRLGCCHSFTPDGRCISLLKILLTNYCVYDCQYCVNRVSNDIPRVRFEPEELVFITMEFYKRNYIEGLFLSSGIIRSADHTMDQMVRVVRSLREEHGFNGYIHIKAVPGASQEMIDQAGRYADRLSANIELPTQADLTSIAPQKSFDVIERSMGQIKDKVIESKAERKKTPRAPRFAPGGQSTQMVVGATPSSDHVILQTASRLYTGYDLKRVYYSAFTPIPGSKAVLPQTPVPLVREHRLYQADWLMRFYGFSADEITSEKDPDLDLKIDPKLSWALRNRHAFPVDVNKADRAMLLRIPGIGVTNVQRILSIRRYHRIRLEDLAKLRVSLKKVKPFLITDDFNPDVLKLDRSDLREKVVTPYQQLELFETATSAMTGQV